MKILSWGLALFWIGTAVVMFAEKQALDYWIGIGYALILACYSLLVGSQYGQIQRLLDAHKSKNTVSGGE